MKNWRPVDHIVLIITLTVSTLLITGLVLSQIEDSKMLRSETVKLLFGTVSSFIAIISMYIGAKVQRNRDNNNGAG